MGRFHFQLSLDILKVTFFNDKIVTFWEGGGGWRGFTPNLSGINKAGSAQVDGAPQEPFPGGFGAPAWGVPMLGLQEHSQPAWG